MTKDMAASVHRKLLNLAAAEDRPFNELLQYFALERFLYRLGCSSYRSQFIGFSSFSDLVVSMV